MTTTVLTPSPLVAGAPAPAPGDVDKPAPLALPPPRRPPSHPPPAIPAMKVYSLSLLALNAATPATSTLLCQVNDLSSFSFYQRGSVGEFMGFFTKVRRVPTHLLRHPHH